MLKYLMLIFLSVSLLSCKNDKTTTEKDKKPETPVVTMKQPKPDPDNGGLILPDGFGALVVIDSLGPSRHIAVNTNGDVYVKLRTEEGRNGNIALRDTDNDGKADILQRFGDYPNDGRFATEMRIHKGYLYFSSEHVVYRQKLAENELIPIGKPEVLVTDIYPMRWHNSKVLAFDNKGGMYVTFSAPTNACEDYRLTTGDKSGIVRGQYPCEQLEILGGIWKFDEARPNQFQKDGIRYATGVRSVVGMAWNEQDSSLYAVNHGRDYLHNHAPQYFSKWEDAVLPAEEFMKIKEGDDFGWPYTYYDPFRNKRMLAPEYGGDGKKEAKGYTDPIMALPAHFAPNDLLFYKGDQFPERYKHGAFIAFHGSVNRTPYPQAGYIVAFLPFQNGKPTGEWEVFADGFTGVDTVVKMQDAKHRPMGLAEGADGALYISESKQGKIWCIKYMGDRAAFSKEQLLGMEERKSRSYIKMPEKSL
ncbi:MAG: sorbosone dehydrogenase [Flavobacteriaceae bacterium]|nr:PQQ-dependent sugar dehydrogenase [Bacteroidia bacterium]NNK69743.1 sorbosone dehydrogenase [Flavobacteriaceae bacterium]NNL80696.1 sorbosone dehydrogenase [Flavobacteriaceae bacterium]